VVVPTVYAESVVTSRWVVELSGAVWVRAKSLQGSHIATPGHRHERASRVDGAPSPNSCPHHHVSKRLIGLAVGWGGAPPCPAAPSSPTSSPTSPTPS